MNELNSMCPDNPAMTGGYLPEPEPPQPVAGDTPETLTETQWHRAEAEIEKLRADNEALKANLQACADLLEIAYRDSITGSELWRSYPCVWNAALAALAMGGKDETMRLVQIPHYSANTAAVIALLEKCVKMTTKVEIHWTDDGDLFLVGCNIGTFRWVEGESKTIPLAICEFAKQLTSDAATGTPEGKKGAI